MAKYLSITGLLLFFVVACGSGRNDSSGRETSATTDNTKMSSVSFDADSAYLYVERQVSFGPRVPNTTAHRLAGDMLVAELQRHGFTTTEQRADLTAYDGTILHARNIFGQINPDAGNRILLLAHYDSRPWADKDPDPEKRMKPVDGANDGASGVGVLLETARQLKALNSKAGIDILFVDAEDYGEEENEDSWAMGARYFAQHPPVPGYAPKAAILLDMVGGNNAVFPREYFSQMQARTLNDSFYKAAVKAGHASLFPDRIGGAITDDHLELLKIGIPAIDIIEYHSDSGFNPHWHTTSDTMENISGETLRAVGESLMTFLESLSAK